MVMRMGTWGAVLAVSIGVATPSLAEVTTTSLRRDVTAFGLLGSVDDENLFETRTEFSVEEGLFEMSFEVNVEAYDSHALGDVAQSSTVSATGLVAMGSIFSDASSAGPQISGEGLAASRIMYDFSVSEPTAVVLSGLVETQDRGKASMTFIGPADVHYSLFVQGEDRIVDAQFMLEPGEHRFSFAMTGFGTATGQNVSMSGGQFNFELRFADVADVSVSSPAQLAPQVFPNPASNYAEIQWSVGELAAEGSGRVEVVDAAGRSIRRLSAMAGTTSNGQIHRAVWDLKDEQGERVSAGAYYMKAAHAPAVRAVVLR